MKNGLLTLCIIYHNKILFGGIMRFFLMVIFALTFSSNIYAQTTFYCPIHDWSISLTNPNFAENNNQYVANYWLKFTNQKTQETYRTQYLTSANVVKSETEKKYNIFLESSILTVPVMTTTTFANDPTINFITVDNKTYSIVFSVKKVSAGEDAVETIIDMTLASQGKTECHLLADYFPLEYPYEGL
jgi:hypothetical protein